MKNFNIDLNSIPVDEESESILNEIKKFKDQGLMTNIDFTKAELEREELEQKLKVEKKTFIKNQEKQTTNQEESMNK